MKVRGVTTTSSPGPMPRPSRARCRPAVAELTAKAAATEERAQNTEAKRLEAEADALEAKRKLDEAQNVVKGLEADKASLNTLLEQCGVAQAQTEGERAAVEEARAILVEQKRDAEERLVALQSDLAAKQAALEAQEANAAETVRQATEAAEARDAAIQSIEHGRDEDRDHRIRILPADGSDDGVETCEHRARGEQVRQQVNAAMRFRLVGWHVHRVPVSSSVAGSLPQGCAGTRFSGRYPCGIVPAATGATLGGAGPVGAGESR